MSQRPEFIPSRFCTSCLPNDNWVPVVNCPAGFPPEIVSVYLLGLIRCSSLTYIKFEASISQLIHHPEYNSSLILRSEIIREDSSNFPALIPSFPAFRKIRYIHRRLLARRPDRDAPLDQLCALYASSDGSQAPDTLVLTPVLQPGDSLPYYHPAVRHLAFRYLSLDPPLLQIEIVPLPNTPTDVNSRLFRITLSLLETLHRYGWGAMTNYKKRVLHDCLVPREAYQDLYLIMRERHKHLVDTWQEVTDPLKHVFEVNNILNTCNQINLSSSDFRTSQSPPSLSFYGSLRFRPPKASPPTRNLQSHGRHGHVPRVGFSILGKL